MLLALVLAVTALQDLADLGIQVAAATGRQVVIDPRLRLPRCEHPPVIDVGPVATSIACTAPAWRFFAAASAPRTGLHPIVDRGDTVTVVAGGNGFRVALDAVAENRAAAGETVRLRVVSTGARLIAQVAPDGSATIPGYTFVDPRR